MEEIVLLESASLRKKLCIDKHTDILDQVGELITLPEAAYATKENVALFYEISESGLDNVISRHKDELEADGYKVMSTKEFKKSHNVAISSKARSIAIFPRRAVLRIGMLLRDSPVAKQIRTYLLNVEQEQGLNAQYQNNLTQMAENLTAHSTQLAKNAQQLVAHSLQLTKNAQELEVSAQNALQQDRMLVAVITEMNRQRSRIDEVSTTVHHIKEDMHKFDRRISFLEQPVLGRDEFITKEQIDVLRGKAKEKGNPTAIWPKFKKHFDLSRYVHLPQRRFGEAVLWLEGYSC